MKKIMVIVLAISIAFLLFACTKSERADDKAVGVVEFISGTFSHRNFTTGHVSDEMIQQILTAGHQAGSAGNQQHWHFTVVRNKELIDEIMQDVDEGNVLIVGLGPNESRFPQDIVIFDNALAMQNMFLTAQALGLGTRMYLRPIQNLNDNLLYRLEAPEDFRAIMVLRIGQLNEIDAVSQPSPRHPLETRVNFIE
ncbi:MAG: nitroreductase family protein [Treponema sp.]|nr:nitroreductase family protein [Treponema sp.]